MKYTKRMLALLLALCMVFTSVQLPVRAEEDSVVETLAEDVPVEDSVVEESELDEVTTDEAAEEESVEEDSVVEETAEEDVTTDDSEEEEVTESEEVVAEEEISEGVDVSNETSEDAASSEENFVEIVAVEEEVVSYAVASAAETDKDAVDAAIFFSDLHSMKNGDSTEGSEGYKKDIVTGMMTALKNTGLTFSSVTSVGDAFSSNETAYTGKTSVITGYIRDALGNPTIPVNYTWSDHDRAALAANDKDLLENKSGLIYGAGADGIYGNEDDGNYYIYAISMSDTSSSERYSQPSTFTIQKLQDFKDAVEGLDPTKPLFIASHQPLLARRSDNQYAYQWCTAINEMAEERDVAFFFGHNHKYDQAGDYYYKKGATMSVQDGSGTKSVELNFTHMCTGYLNPSTTGSAGSSRQGTVMLVTIYDDEINYTTYCATGEYKGDNAVNEDVDRDHIVKTVTYEDNILTIKAASSGLTAIDAENVTGEYGLNDYFTDHIAYNVELTGHKEDEKIDYSILFLDDMDDTNVELYHVDDEGNMIEIPYKMITDEYGRRYLEFTTTYTGVFAYGAQGVPEGYTLSELKVSNIEKTTYFVGDNLDLVSQTVTAVYSKEGSEDFTRIVDIKDDFVTTDGYTVSGYDMTKAGKQTVVISYEGLTCSFDVEVFAKSFSDEKTGVSIELTVPGVSEFTVTESANQHVESALKGLVKEGTIVAYDIEVKDYKNGDVVTVTMPIPEGIGNPVVYYVSDSGKSAVNMNATDNGDGTVSFDTNHFSTYVLADGTTIELESGNATVEGSSITTSKEVYVLTNSIAAGDEVIIVSSNSATSDGYVLGTSTSSEISVNILSGDLTVDNKTSSYTYIEDESGGLVWTVGTGYKFTSGTYKLGINNNSLKLDRESNWTYSNYSLKENSSNRYLRYNNGWISSSWTRTICIYKKVTTSVTTNIEGHTYSVEGTNITDAVAIANGKVTLSSALKDTTTTGTKTDITENQEWSVRYEVVTTKGNPNVIAKDANGNYLIDGNVATLSGVLGTAVIKATYTSGNLTAWAEFVVTTNPPHHYGIQLHKAEMTEVEITEFAADVTYYTYNSETNTYQVANSYVEGTTYYTIPVIQGDEITKTVALKGIKAGDTYSVWAVVKAYESETDEEGIDLGTLGNALSWSVSDASIANINTETGVITFTGDKYDSFTVTVSYEGADGLVVLDTITISVTENLYIVPEDGTNDFPEYPNEGSIRFDKTATAVGNFSETGIAKVEISLTGVPYTENNRLDVVLMLDRSSSMYKSGVEHRISSTIVATQAFVEKIVKNEDGTFNNNRIIVMDFLGGNLDSSQGGGSQHAYESNLYTTPEDKGYQVINDQDELDALLEKIENDFKGQTTLFGTEYAQGLENCYDALKKSRSDGNKQFCVFMSDGIPNYMMGETTHFKKTSDITGTFDVTNRTAANGTAARNATKYEYEYYSTKMKDEGVTVFTVGLGLNNTNSAWSGTSKEVCEQVANMLLNDISGPAGESEAQRDKGSAVSKLNTYFFSVTDDKNNTDAVAAQMKKVFSGISQKIMEAARDVVVEDKIGNNYSVNFALPGNVTAEKTDGISDFYIQAVEYTLNDKKERVGDPKVLENFTFSSPNGTFKSHEVNGVLCNNCNHVTYTAGVITAINGTYFDYTSKVVGECTEEYLTWENEKVGSTELALQYFAHLDNSSDAVGDTDEIPAGTYYTNEYATLTYTNYNDNRVQEEFPVPQLTWNGAQVSYVFYLVNAAGQPVNSAGRVVPFAEVVYVTAPQTHHVIWNDLEQTSALEANLLAKDRVPDVYALYDDDAVYNIHVFEDEKKSNLNNHFVIDGDVTDSYNANWTNDKTTYVFNNKSDEIKYNTAAVYIANDGDDTTISNKYLCKGQGTVDATISIATGVTAANFATQPYFTKIDGKYTIAEEFEPGVTYYEISSASYEKADDEVQWKPDANKRPSGGTLIDGYVYYIGEGNEVYTIVQKDDGNEVRTGFDFHNTTVAFAVVWKPQLEPDTVVVDYGLDVVVDVIKNDGMAAGVVGVCADAPSNVSINSGTYGAAKVTSADIYIDADNDTEKSKELKIGTASVENMNSVRFTLDKENGMQFNKPAEFYYEADVNYYNSENQLVSTSMYSSVTVIPATTVYYEDEYVTLTTYTRPDTSTTNYTAVSGWPVDSVAAKKTQAEDRPGQHNIANVDANNIYGFDNAYEKMSTHSMGDSAMIHVDATQYGTAEFEFYGTGFDVISTTSNTTGTLVVQVYDAATNSLVVQNNKKLSKAVDTYYGYVYGFYNVVYEMGEDGLWNKTSVGDSVTSGDEQTKEDLPKDAKAGDIATIRQYTWKAVENTPSALYQVPVMKVDGLDYGKYKVKISALYYEVYDSTSAPGYDLYLDAIRVYNPAGVHSDELGETIHNAYAKDGEFFPSYRELRNLLIESTLIKNLTGNEAVDGIVLIDGNEALSDSTSIGESAVVDYMNYGPNNELYLAQNQAVAFNFTAAPLEGYTPVVHLGMKTVGGKTAVAKLWNVNGNGGAYNVISKDIETATDMYYDITSLVGNNIVITNEGESSSILSITNIKVGYKVNPEEDSQSGATPPENNGDESRMKFTVTRESVEAATLSLRASIEENAMPEIDKPSIDEPDVNKPSADEPAINKPGTDEPSSSKPNKDNSESEKLEVSIPMQSDVTKPETQAPGVSIPAESKIENTKTERFEVAEAEKSDTVITKEDIDSSVTENADAIESGVSDEEVDTEEIAPKKNIFRTIIEMIIAFVKNVFRTLFGRWIH